MLASHGREVSEASEIERLAKWDIGFKESKKAEAAERDRRLQERPALRVEEQIVDVPVPLSFDEFEWNRSSMFLGRRWESS